MCKYSGDEVVTPVPIPFGINAKNLALVWLDGFHIIVKYRLSLVISFLKDSDLIYDLPTEIYLCIETV